MIAQPPPSPAPPSSYTPIPSSLSDTVPECFKADGTKSTQPSEHFLGTLQEAQDFCSTLTDCALVFDFLCNAPIGSNWRACTTITKDATGGSCGFERNLHVPPPPPPLPPGVPPPPPTPLAPSGSITANAASAGGYQLGFDLGGADARGCVGVVFWTAIDGREYCTLRSSTRVVTGTPDSTHGVYSGSYIFVKSAPPPPPNIPSSAVCNQYRLYPDTQIPITHPDLGTSNLIPGVDGLTIKAADYQFPWE